MNQKHNEEICIYAFLVLQFGDFNKEFNLYLRLKHKEEIFNMFLFPISVSGTFVTFVFEARVQEKQEFYPRVYPL